MTHYYFNLWTSTQLLLDPDGTALPDETAARSHARSVAHDLMRNRAAKTRSWRLDVRDGDGRRCFSVLFASVDDTVPPELRAAFIDGSTQAATLRDAIHQVRLSLLQVKATMAKADRHPYLAAVDGISLR
jgi:hypothetical protein